MSAAAAMSDLSKRKAICWLVAGNSTQTLVGSWEGEMHTTDKRLARAPSSSGREVTVNVGLVMGRPDADDAVREKRPVAMIIGGETAATSLAGVNLGI